MKQNAGILFHGGRMDTLSHSAYDHTGKRKYLNATEGRAFLASAVNLSRPRALFCLFLFYTGCRISEALSIKGDDIDLLMGTVKIRSLKKRKRIEFRRVPIPEFLIEGLQDLVSVGQELLWTFSRTTAWRTVKLAMKTGGVEGIHATAKGLRHGFGVRGALGQVPPHLIQRWMGHADLQTTAIYLEVHDEEERAIIAKTWG